MNDTLPKLLVANAQRFGDRVALREKEFGIWQTLSWAEYLDRVRAFSLGLIRLGLQRGDKIAIIGDNRPEWVIAELAAQSAGAISMGVYQDAVAAEVQYLVDFSDARFVIAEDQEQVDKLLEVWEQLPKAEYIIYYDPRGMRHYNYPFLFDFQEVESLGRAHHREHPNLFQDNVERTRAEDVAIFSTTSGTTGKPKLAMLTHRNLTSMARHLIEVDPLEPRDEYLSFLPLAWIGEQMMSVATALVVGFTVNFPEEPETVRENLREIGPHVMFSPPRIWESLVSEIQVKIEDTTRLKRALYEWAMRVGYRMADAHFARQEPSPTLRRLYRLADWLIFMPIKDKFGLRRLRRAYTGGAALGPDVFRFFHALGVNLKQIYGQTEISGISVLHRDGDIKFQTVGLPLPETEVRIAENGEILSRSPAVFAGYYKNPEATAETLVEGWLHSGDAGYFDEDGHLIVIDRAADVMTLADGTKFSPQFIENKLKFSPYIKEAVVFGGGDYPFVTALINIDYANVGTWAERRQIAYTTYTDLAQKAEVYELIRHHVKRTNDDLPPAARIQRFLLLHKELDADDAELTRTRKVRRRFVAQRYEELVTALYSDVPSVEVETTITYQDGRTATIRTALRVETLTAADEAPALERAG
ncbi:MAG: long-chain fatty acid--CoA ligase [Ardenticatenia bacterium]|nr:long-chain fatty acid--CoA ligase [Ardenticatenia bacterium]